MSEWIDFGIYAALSVAFWFILPSTQSSLAIPVLADRNPDWLAAHPEAAQKISASRWYQRSCYVLGVLSLGALLSCQLGLWPEPAAQPGPQVAKWIALSSIHLATLGIGVIYVLTCAVIGTVFFARAVPIAPQRQAALERRSIDDFVPRSVRVVTYALVLITWAAWLTVGALDLYSTPIFWIRVALVFALPLFFFFFTHLSVNRRPNALDRIFGPVYRRGEVRYAFLMQLLTPVIGAARLYEEVAGTVVFDANRAMGLGLALFVTFGLLRSARYARSLRNSSGAAPPRGTESPIVSP